MTEAIPFFLVFVFRTSCHTQLAFYLHYMATVMQQYNTTPIRMRCARIHRKCYFPTSANSFHIISWYRQLASTTYANS